jgi:hypothetical protein
MSANKSTKMITIRSVTLALLFAGASVGASQAATRIGWVWADQPSAVSEYTPDAGYSYNSAGGAISITRSATGSYAVKFAGLGNSLTDNVLVTAYGSNGTCKVGSWGASGADQYAYVYCFDAAGAAADSYFDLVYQAHSGNIGTSSKGLAFLWANDSTSPSYTPSTGYQYNSTGGTNTITRSGVGVYHAFLPGLDKVGGHVQVTAYGSTADRCKTSGWSSDSSGTYVDVLCFDSAGAPVDTRYTLEYSRHLPTAFLTTATTKGFYAWASQPSSASYTTSGPYSYNAYGTGKITAVRDDKGYYHLSPPTVGSYSTSNVLVTAYGSDNSYCNSSGWYPVYVSCYKQGGDAVNSRFNASFQTH